MVGGLDLVAYIFALEELREDGERLLKRISTDGVFEAIKTRVIDRIVENISFELNKKDLADINDGVKDAINDYLFPQKGGKND
jgi:hypothetical protein